MAEWIFPAAQGEPMLKQVPLEELAPMKGIHTAAAEQCEEEAAAERQQLCTDCNHRCTACTQE